MPGFVLLLCLLAPPPNAELERTDQLIQQVTEMKAKVSALQAEIDALLRTLSEQRGAQQKGPQPFAYLTPSEGEGSPKSAAATVRCAANTSNGKRCTRPAEAGSRYCWQHKLAHSR